MNRQKHIYFLVVFAMCLVGFSAHSQSRAQLEKNRKEIQAEIRTIQSLLSQTQTEEKGLLSQLNEINIRIDAQKKLIDAFRAESKALNNDIKANEKEINKLNKELEKLKADYAQMIYKSYKSKSQNSRIMFLLSSENFHQAYKRFQYMKQYASFRKSQGVQINQISEDLISKNDTLNIRKKEKEALIEEQKTEQTKIEDEKKIQESIVAKIKKKERKYKNDIKKKQKEERKIDAEIEKIIRDAIAASNNTGTVKSDGKPAEFALTAESKLLATQFEGNKGNLPWPVERGFVSRRYGKQKHPTLDGILIESNGVRITTGKGSMARAIYEGTILQIQSVSGKKAVYIQHGNYITVYNNLETVSVKKGEKVDTKDIIGKVYTDKVSKKTILKFQVWKNTTRLNPASWIYKM